MNSIGNIDENILEKTAEVRSKRKSGKGWIKWVAAVAACLLIAGTVSFFAFRRVADPVALVAEITPTAVDKDGVYANTQFLIAGGNFDSKDDLVSQLTTNAGLEYGLEKTSGGNYLLTFDGELKADSICNFLLNDGNGNDRSYSFQVRADFAVKAFYPENSATVDENSGVEITFTTDAFADYEDYISIIPDTPHKTEKLGNKVIITPETVWETGKIYNVVIEKEMADSQGRTLGAAYASTFFASSGHDLVRRSGSIDETFLTSDVPVIELLCDTYGNFRDYGSVDFDVVLSSIPSAEEYEKVLGGLTGLDAMRPLGYYSTTEYSYVDTANMNTYMEASLSPVPYDTNDFRKSYIVLPDTLPEGYYLATATCTIDGGSYKIQKLIQINDTAVYMRSSENRLLVWANDTVSGNAVSGAEVVIDGESRGKTGTDGRFEYDCTDGRHSATVRINADGHKPFVAPVILSSQKDWTVADKYYTYIYTDRESYLRTDKISVFGLVKPRDGEKMPGNVTVCFGEIEYGYNEVLRKEHLTMDNSVFAQASADVDDNGTFTAVIPFENFKSGSFCVAFKIGSEIASYKYITIENYTKPAYVLNTDVSKLFCFAGDSFEVNLNASYYGGIPAAGETFSVSGDYSASVTAVTDSEGNAGVTMTAPVYNEARDCTMQYASITVNDESLLERVNTFCRHYCVFPRDVMLEADVKAGEDGTYSVSGLCSMIDIEKANGSVKEFSYGISADDYRGSPYDTPVMLYINKTTFGEPVEYTYYDYINKCNVTTVKYEGGSSETMVYEEELNPVSGSFAASVALEPVKNGYYVFSFAYKDAAGRECVYNVFPTYNYGYEDTTGLKHYFITDKDTVPYYYYYGNDIGEYRLGDSIHMKLLDEKAVPVNGGKLLIGTINSRTEKTEVIGAGAFDFEFTEKCVPSVKLTGAYFDGHRIYDVVTTVIGYDCSEKELKPEISTDKDSYRPGEEAKITVTLRDADGKPHRGSVSISVVDEAQFAVAPQYASILGNVYKTDLSDPLISSYVSYTQHSFNGENNEGGEGGGGEDEPDPRQDFVDTAAFETVVTGSDGVAELTVKIPDNITDWRITVNAVSNDLYCGNAVKNISSVLPFVADVTVGTVFQEGDDISVTAHVYGTAVNDSTPVAYTAQLTNPDGTTETLSDSATGHAFASLNFGKKPKGKYSVKVTAKSSAGEDALIKEFDVVESADEADVFEEFELTDGISLNATKSPVTLVFGNSNAKYVYSVLTKLYRSCGSRNDQVIAADAAGRMLRSFADEEDRYLYPESGYAKGSLQKEWYGGVAANSFAEADMLTTAFAVWCNPDIIDYSTLNNYLRDHDDIEKYIALAAMGRPVLIEVKNLLAETAPDDYYARLVYTCALAALGDDAAASDEFGSTFGRFVVFPEEGKAMLSISGDDYVNETMTAMALTVLSVTDRDTAAAMMNYLSGKEDLKDFYGMQYVIYAKNILRGAHGSASFEYTLDGERKTVTLKGAQTKTLKMTLDRLDAADFLKTDGDISVTAYYTGNTDAIETDKTGKMQKIIEFAGEPVLGGKVLIEMTLSVPAEEYVTVTDYIPSGMRFSRSDVGEHSNSWLVSQEGQKTVWGIWSKDGYARITYYARAVAKGNFVFNRAYVYMKDGTVAIEPQSFFKTIK